MAGLLSATAKRSLAGACSCNFARSTAPLLYRTAAAPASVRLPICPTLCDKRYFSCSAQTDNAASSETHVVPPPTPLFADLARLRSMMLAVDQISSKAEKDVVLQSYRDLGPLLVYIHKPHVRFHVKSGPVIKRAQEKALDISTVPVPIEKIRQLNVFGLLQLLAGKVVSGHAAIDLVLACLAQGGRSGIETEKEGGLDMQTVLMRCLNRNLKVGVSGKTIDRIFASNASTAPPPREVAAAHDKALAAPKKATSKAKKATPKPIDCSPKEWGVALGKAVEPEAIERAFAKNPDHAYYMSRKLDGIRCILKVTLAVDELGKPEMVDSIAAFSRTQREFYTLDVLEEHISEIVLSCPALLDTIRRAQETGQKLSEWDEGDESADDGVVQIYLDGEVCVRSEVGDGGESKKGAAMAMNEADERPFVEDFQSVSGLIRRHDFTIPNPVYFPFDVLTYDEFHYWHVNADKHQPFSERLARVDGLVETSRKHHRATREVADEPYPLRSVGYARVTRAADVEQHFATAVKNGWEGLMLRRDGPYEGKRTSALLKVKLYTDKEYVVKDIEISSMRLAINGKFEEHRALASVIIEHKGFKVNVGSGFTADQRVKFAKDPSSIIGSMVTVLYFAESETTDKAGQKVLSLRFPTVKTVWEGKRDV